MASGGARPGAGRKKGVRNKVTADVKAIAQQYGQEAITALVEIAISSDAPAAARVSAANALLDRGYGKPAQSVELTGKDGGPISTKTERDLTDEELAAELGKYGIEP